MEKYKMDKLKGGILKVVLSVMVMIVAVTFCMFIKNINNETNVNVLKINTIVNNEALTESTEYITSEINISNEPDASVIGLYTLTESSVTFGGSALVYTGSALMPEPMVKYNNITLVKDMHYTLTYSNNVNVGTATMTVTGIENYSGSIDRTFEITQRPISEATISGLASYYYTGSDITPTPILTYNGMKLIVGTDYYLSYSNNCDPGTAAVTIKGKGNYSDSITKNFTISPCNIEGTIVATSVIGESYFYTGAEIKPRPDLDCNGIKLVDGVDYVLTYYGENYTNVGEKQITIDGIGNYTGCTDISYWIVARPISTVTISSTVNKIYTGGKQTQSLILTHNEMTLISGMDYTLSYSNNINVGTATITITGKGNYTDTTTMTFNIVPRAISEATASAIADILYTTSAIIPVISLTYNDMTLVNGRDYTLSYSNNINVGTATITITGKGNYTGTTSRTFEIVPRAISEATASAIADIIYTTSANTPVISLTYNDMTLVNGTDYTLSYSNNINVGTATISITGLGNYTGTATKNFTIVKRDLADCAVELSAYSLTYNTSYQSVDVTVRIGSTVLQSGYTVIGNGGTGQGNYIVTVTAVDGKNLTGSNATKSFVITPKALEDSMVVASIAGQTYTGNEIRPTPSLSYLLDNPMVFGTDYTTSYVCNTSVGTATVIIVGTGNYTGNISKTFTITALSIDDSSITVEPLSSEVYTGSAITPLPAIKRNETTLVKGTDYVLSYIDNKNVGTASVVISGTGNYTGTVIKKFSVLSRSLSYCTIQLSSTSLTYNTENQSVDVTVKIDSTIIDASNYTVSGNSGKNQGEYTVTVTAVDGKNLTGSNATKSFVITPKALEDSMVAAITDQTYTGNKIEPALSLSYLNDESMVAGTDYTVVYASNTNVGTATVTITGKGNYTGDVSTTFEIGALAMTDASITVDSISDVVYTGSEITPLPVVRLNGVALVEGTDYTLVYSNNTNASSNATIIITGKGNFTGSRELRYTISPLDINGGELVVGDEVYTGLELIPIVSLVVDGKTLVKDTDFTVVASNNINVGQANISVIGKGNYTGTINSNFTISTRSLSEVDIDNIAIQNYTGSEIKPVLYITYNTRPLTEGTDFECEYQSNINIGTATITIVGQGNFEGTREVTFEIASVVISSLTLGGTTFVYDTVEKFPGITVKYGNVILTPNTDYIVTGDASATNVGEYTITVTGNGGYRGTLSANWSITSRGLGDCNISLDENIFTYSGSEYKPNVIMVTKVEEYTIGEDNYVIEYSDNTDVGTGKVTITGKGNLTGTTTKTFTINAKSIDDNDCVVVIEKQTYTSVEIEPTVLITYNGRTLEEGTDYICSSYEDNINVGTAQVVITGQGNYSNATIGEFEIEELDIAECSVTLSFYNVVYTAQEQVASVEVRYGDSLIDSSNYIVTGNSGKDVGTYTVVVTGQNNLKGVDNSQVFVVSAKELDENWVENIPNQIYIHDGNGNATAVTLEDGELVVEWEGTPLVSGTDYTFELANATTIYEDETFQDLGNIPTVTITGMGNYTGTISKYFVIYDNNIATDSEAEVSIAFDTHTYTSAQIKPKVTVVWDGSEVQSYNVEYSNNINVGTATVVITALGDYHGVVTKTFTIAQADISYLSDEIGVPAGPYIYNGSEHTPVPYINYDYVHYFNECTGCVVDTYESCRPYPNTSFALVVGDDFTYEITNNINVGSAVVTCVGKGNFTGTLSTSFTIESQNISIASIGDLAQSSYKYTGSNIEPTIVVSYNNGNETITLEKDKDYSVVYENNVNVGNATIVVTGIGNYTGEITKTFTIYAEGLGTVALDKNSFVYDATSKTPAITVKLGDETLVNGADYEVSGVASASEVGSYTIIITGIGNFNGQLSADWSITPRVISDCYVTINEDDLIYAGSEIKPSVVVKIAEDGAVVSSALYTAVYSANINVGTASVVITGNTNLEGSITKTFIISARNLSDTEVATIADQKFTSLEVKPAVAITFNGNALVLGEDYTLEYSNNINSGTNATIEIIGKGNYDGKITRTFKILPHSIASEIITIEKNTYSYTGSPIDANPTLTAFGVELEKDTDYVVQLRLGSPTGETVQEAKNVGNYYLIVNGIGNYTGSKFVGFNIVKATPTVVIGCADSAIFAGKPVRLEVINSSVGGTVYCSQTSYIEGEYTYQYTFVPTDTTNYNVVQGSITLTAQKLEAVALVFSGEFKTNYMAYETLNTANLVVSLKYNNNETQELYLSEYTFSMLNGAILRVGDKVTITYINNSNIKADLPITVSPRVVVATLDQTLIDNGEAQEIVFTFANEVSSSPVTYTVMYYNIVTGMVVENIINAGKYKAIITLTNNNYTLEENEVMFEVLTKTLVSTDEGLVVEGVDGFAPDEVFTYEVEKNENVVLKELGIAGFNVDKQFVSVYSFELAEDKDVVVTLSLDMDSADGVTVYKLENNKLITLPHSIVEGNKISISCNTADKLYIFKDTSYIINDKNVDLVSAIVVLLAIVVVGLVMTMFIERRGRLKLVKKNVGNISSVDSVQNTQDVTNPNTDEDNMAKYVIIDDAGNVVGLREGAPAELQQAFNEMRKEIETENNIENGNINSTEDENIAEVEQPVQEIVSEQQIEETQQEQSSLSDEEMIDKYTIVDEAGNIIGLKDGAPEELKQTYNMLVDMKEAKAVKVEQSNLSYEEMIANYAIIDESGKVIGLKDGAPEELRQTYETLLNKNDNE